MMFTVVGVSSFSILWYTWSSIYMSSHHTQPPSHCFPAEVWSFPSLASVDTKGCYLHSSAAPDQTHLYLIHGVHRSSAHTKGRQKSLGLIKAIWNRAKTNPLVLTPCTANSVQHLQLFLSNGKFMFSELQQQTFWPSGLPPPSSI